MIKDIASSPLTAAYAVDGATDTLEPRRCSCALAHEDRRGQAYNEEAFHYFLAVERKRSEWVSSPLLLLLVDLQENPPGHTRIGAPLARKLFLGLGQCTGEIDFIGWYRHERVVGAVLLEDCGESWMDVSSLVRQRAMRALKKYLSPAVARTLRVRVYCDPARDGSDSAPSSRRQN